MAPASWHPPSQRSSSEQRGADRGDPPGRTEEAAGASGRSRWADLHLAAVVVLALVLVVAAAVGLALPASDVGEVATVLLICVALVIALAA